jgi:hypothetical protein
MKLPHRRGSFGAVPPAANRPGCDAGIALSGMDVFVTNLGANTVGEYTTAGATVNASLISGLIHPAGIAVAPPVGREEQRYVSRLQ